MTPHELGVAVNIMSFMDCLHIYLKILVHLPRFDLEFLKNKKVRIFFLYEFTIMAENTTLFYLFIDKSLYFEEATQEKWRLEMKVEILKTNTWEPPRQ
jgi:hypothetical protein